MSQPSADFLEGLPKAELHIHLEGSVQPETVLKLAHRHGMVDRLPGDSVDDLKAWFTFKHFRHFIKIYLTIQDLLRTAEDFSTVTYECGADMAAQNIRYREVTFTPYTHTHFQDKGLTVEAILEGLEDGRQRALHDFGVEIRWVFDVARNLSFKTTPDGTRSYDPHPADTTLQQALLGRDYGVVAFGLGGFEGGAPPEPFAHAFEKAKSEELYSCPHAGETVGPESIWGAINTLGAQRIGHGVRAIEDPELLVVLKEKQIPLEVNITSNVCLHVYPSVAHHPFPHLDAMGLVLTINSDDPPLFNTNLVNEYRLLGDIFGYRTRDIIRIARNAFVVSAAEAELKARLLSEFDNWVTEYA